jgi:glycosyltransferase involved in cell wall biosynthesis
MFGPENKKSSLRSVVVYTQEYPTPNDPTDGVFTEQLVSALSQRLQVTVVCPMPWWPRSRLLGRWSDWVPSTNVPSRRMHAGVSVYHPKVPLIPYVTRHLQPFIQALRALPLMRRLKRQGRLGLLSAHSIYPDGVAAALLSDWLDVPLLLTAIGSDININLHDRWRLWQIKWAMRRARAAVGVSEDLCRKMRGFGLGVPIVRIPNGVDKSRFYPPSAASPWPAELGDDRRPIVLFVGRLHPVKGIKYLVAALGKLKREARLAFRTLIIGEGPEQPTLLLARRALGLDADVQFLGPRPHHEIADWLRLAHAACLPSLNEGMPNVVIEAQACGVPVVATRVGGVGELIADDTGILVPPGDTGALADALAQSVARQWNRSKIAEHVSWADWNRSAEKYLELVSESRC